MRFKNPGGELSWLSPLMFVCGSAVAYFFYQEGSLVLAAMFASIGFLCLLVWFDMKWVAIPLIGWFSLLIVAGVLYLIFKEFSWRKTLHLIAMTYTIHALWEWYRRVEPKQLDPEMEELMRLKSPISRRGDETELTRGMGS